MTAVREVREGVRVGEVGERIQSMDWSRTPLGDPATWPSGLRASLDICVHSRCPIAIIWGPEKTTLYNDAFVPMLGSKHPWALGAPSREVWSEMQDVAGWMLDQIMSGGEATFSENMMLPVQRHGFTEEAYFTFSCAPIHDEDGQVGGAFVTASETTNLILGERRLEVLEDLGARAMTATSEEDACVRAARALARGSADVPFALVYLSDSARYRARLVASTGLPEGSPALVPAIALSPTQHTSGWPLGLATRTAITVDDLFLRFGTVVAEPWPEPIRRAVVLPLRSASEPYPLGYVVLGLSPRLIFDSRYAGFFDLVAEHTSAAVESARTLQAQRGRAESLTEIDRAKTQFFANVSHDFRTPLTLMMGPLTEAIASPARALAGEELEVVHRNSLRLLKLVNTILDFSRIEAGQMDAQLRPTHLAMLTTDIASTFRPAMERAGLRFEISCQPATEAVPVDRDMWEKIVLNLLSNALNFTFEGSVRVRLYPVDDRIALEVEDTGVGIPEDELPHIFDRFHRGAHPRARTHEGTGIGLALVRELAQLQGGSVEVSSEVGRGTTFTVSIPRRRADTEMGATGAAGLADPIPDTDIHSSAYLVDALRWPAATEVVVSLPAASEGIGGAARRGSGVTHGVDRSDRDSRDGLDVDLSGAPGAPARALAESHRGSGPSAVSTARVLVADDNSDMRDYLARLLRPRWNVETIDNGADALAMIRRDRPDLVVADVMMPGLDGFELIQALRAEAGTGAIPVLLLSARAGEEAVAEGLRAGADDYLVKPFAAGTLIARVEKLINEARAREAARARTEAERARLEMMFNDSPAAAIVVRGPDLILDFANRNALVMWGKSSDVIGRTLPEAIPELDTRENANLVRQVLETGKPAHFRNAVTRIDRHGNGILTDVYFDYSFVPLHEPDGTVSSVFVHAFDVTDLVAERRAAEAANRMKDEFLATVSHELRAPLNAILGWTSLLRSSASRDLRERALATIERSVRTQVRLIEDILDVERIVSGKLRLDISRVNIASMIDAAIDIVRPAAEEKHVRIEVALQEDVGSIDGDPDRLQQVVCNLLGNAVKFTPDGGTILLRARRSGGKLTIRVRDNGVGIPAQYLPHVFERFRQVPEMSSGREGGLGIGLEIVRSLVEMHGGTVTAQSHEGVGTMFTVILPTGREDARSEPLVEARGEAQP